MSKKIPVFFGLLIAVIVIVIVLIFQLQKKSVTPILQKKSAPAARKLKEYIDSSGFKFSYPEDLKVVAKDVSTSNSLYADLAITSPGRKGQLTIKVKDATKTFFDEFIKDKTTIQTKLDDVDAYQYQEKNQLITTAYDQGVQFTFAADLSQEKSYWFDINKQIINSFKFVQPEQPASPAGGSTGGDEVVFEGEEVIE